LTVSTGHRIAISLRAAYLTLHRRTDASLADVGVTADQFVVLDALAKGDAITQQELARRAASDPNTIGTMLVLLEGRGLVARDRHPTDGRARSVTLTAAGRQTHRRAWIAVQPLQEELLRLFLPDDAEALIERLARVSGSLARARGRRPQTRSTRRPAKEKGVKRHGRRRSRPR
jgi:DNA-binding MarR family transcriptional regulator